MAGELIAQLVNRLNGRAIISADIGDEDLRNVDLESLGAYLLVYFENSGKLNILDKALLEKAISMQRDEKKPLEIEVSQATSFRPVAKEIEAEYSTRHIEADKTFATVNDFTLYFNDRLERLRDIIERGRGGVGMISSIDKIGQYANGREISVVGMVYDKIITKNGNVMATIEDETGSAKVIFLKSDRNGRRETSDLFETAKKIVYDEVIAVRGRISHPFIMANALMWPDVPIKARNTVKEDIAVAFTSDIHVGSRLFLEKQFGRFLEWINGNIDYKKGLAEKIKYIVISGDLVDGIGVYPNQDKELGITDIYKQYSMLFDLLSDIPEYVHLFLLPGNHDAVRLAEPQPYLTEDLVGDFKQDNIHLISNPGYITLHGIRILANHGTALDSIIQCIPGCSYSSPETAMIEVLKKRHISPIYGDNPITPGKRDVMVIDEIPDILHMGHVHKNGYAEYHGTQLINSGTWQSRTSYQIKLGHVPTPALLPVCELKAGNIIAIDFNNVN